MPNLVNTRLLIKNVAAKKMIIMELYNSVTTVRKHWVVIAFGFYHVFCQRRVQHFN